MPARARSEGKRFLPAGARSVWAPASLEGGHVGHTGVELVCVVLLSLCLLSLLSFFLSFCSLVGFLGVICLLLKVVWFMWLWCMIFREPRFTLRKLRLTEKLLDAVLCELAVVASGQPCLIVGDLIEH